MNEKLKIRGPVLHLILGLLLLLILILVREFRPREVQKKPAVPSAVPSAPISKQTESPDPFSPERLVDLGERVLFRSNHPQLDPNQGLSVGRGQCPACHVILPEQKPNRFPSLIGVIARAGERIKEERYKTFSQRYAEAGEPKTGIRPHAKTAGEYLIESIYCPSCYVVEGLGVQETADTVSMMPIIPRPELGLSDYEMVAVVAYLQAADAQGDLSKVTAKQDWENYFGKKLTLPEGADKNPLSIAAPQDLSKVGLSKEPPDVIIEKLACYVCHKIPTVRIAQVGTIGPVLTLKTTAEKRIQSPEYQRALSEGKVRATTPKAYIIESILNPSGFIVPGFDDAMPKNFKEKLTFGAVENLAEFLLTLDEEAMKSPFQSSPDNSGNISKTRD
jgi:cytochrome c2